MQVGQVWLGVGANVPGAWGPPAASLARLLLEFDHRGIRVVSRSSLYATAPLGQPRQPRFLNAVVGVRTSLGPVALLAGLKRLERVAGRSLGRRWGPRPLDIDILDYGGRRIGVGRDTRQRGRLVLPHPGLPDRGFVLVPLAEAAPGWRHPVLCCSARDLLRRQPRCARDVVRVGPWL